MAAVADCPNHDVNLEMCPCPSEDCERKGICCLCAQYHVGRGQKSSCMRDTERPVESCSLRGIGSKCDRYKENLEFCPCDYEPCENRGTCCDCVRNHWGNATYPSPACMRS